MSSPDGIYFVPLQPLISSQYVVSAIVDVLELSLSNQDPLLIQLLNDLRTKDILLILDNMEHLLDGTDLIHQLLGEAPGLKFLVTSRETLNMGGEWLYPLKGLNYPVNIDAEDAEHYTAVQLFIDCARRLRPDFRLSEHQKEVIRICQLVEGMPLALELAAAWIKVLPYTEIVTQIQHSLTFLTTNQRNIPERHQSIQAVFDYSWKLLTEVEQAIFKKLAVFS